MSAKFLIGSTALERKRRENPRYHVLDLLRINILEVSRVSPI